MSRQYLQAKAMEVAAGKSPPLQAAFGFWGAGPRARGLCSAHWQFVAVTWVPVRSRAQLSRWRRGFACTKRGKADARRTKQPVRDRKHNSNKHRVTGTLVYRWNELDKLSMVS